MKIHYSCVFAASIIFLLVASACHNSNNQKPEETGYNQISNDTIEIAEGSNLLKKIVSEEVVLTPYVATIKTTGVISPIPTAYAEIAAPLPGRVVKSHIHIGQSVKQGSPLFDIASSEYSEIAKSYIQSHSEMLQAERTLNRVKDLYDNHVASSKELEEAQTAYNIAREEYNHAQAVTKEYQIGDYIRADRKKVLKSFSMS